MDELNKKYDIGVEVLTPLSIGAGAEKEWVRGVDFVVKDGVMYKLNLSKILNLGIDPLMLSNLFSSKDEKGLMDLITESRLSFASDFEAEFATDSPNNIKTFIRSQFKDTPLLAGSSLKGAIRSVLYEYLKNNGKNTDTDEHTVFGPLKDGSDFMRFIKVSDGEFADTFFCNTKIFNLWKSGDGGWNGGWKDSGRNTTSDYRPIGFNTLYECINVGERCVLNIMINKNPFNVYNQHESTNKKREIVKEGISCLFRIINEHTKKYLLKEKAFFKKYSEASNSEEILESIDRLISQIPEDNSYCIIKMSAGSGFHSITGDWQFDDYCNTGTWGQGKNEGKLKYKSRKIAISEYGFDLMGFVKLSSLSKSEVVEIQGEVEKKIRAKREKLEERQKEIERIIQEKKMAAKLAVENEKKFKVLVNEAEICEKGGDLSGALAKYNEAEILKPGHCIEEIKSIRERIDTQEKLKGIEELQKKQDEEKRLQNKIPLKQKIEKINKLDTLFGNVRTWKKQNDIDTLSDSDLQTLKEKTFQIYNGLSLRDKKKMKSFGKELDNLVTSDIAAQWYKEITNG